MRNDRAVDRAGALEPLDNPIQKYWKEPTEANRTALREFLRPQTTKFQYIHGVSDETLVAPESYALDSALLARPGNDEIQLALFLDYASNIALYPKCQEYFRTKQPPLLAVWGRNDPFFLPPGAEAFKRDDPNAEVRFYDSGHFALETHARNRGCDPHFPRCPHISALTFESYFILNHYTSPTLRWRQRSLTKGDSS
jgi:pimeloyl-ACP methyl ester carboxylesterase